MRIFIQAPPASRKQLIAKLIASILDLARGMHRANPEPTPIISDWDGVRELPEFCIVTTNWQIDLVCPVDGVTK